MTLLLYTTRRIILGSILSRIIILSDCLQCDFRSYRGVRNAALRAEYYINI